MDRLTLRYRYDASFFDPDLDRNDFGRLSVEVKAQGFAGRGGFWVQWQEVREFGTALAVYPIAKDSPVVVQWGYEMLDGDDLILRIEVSPADKLGNLIVRFEVADDEQAQNRVRGSFLTNYSDLDAFRLAIVKLMDNEIEEAVLVGR